MHRKSVHPASGDKVADTKETNLFNPHDNLTGRDGGPYLDLVERERAEVLRAKVEDREPDFDNAPAVAGTPLVTGPQLAAMANPASNPSQSNFDPAARAVDAMAESEDFPVTAVQTLDMPDLSAPSEYRAADPTIRSVDGDSNDEPVIVEQDEPDLSEPAEPNASGDPLLGS
jgi:hypothetical protein